MSDELEDMKTKDDRLQSELASKEEEILSLRGQLRLASESSAQRAVVESDESGGSREQLKGVLDSLVGSRMVVINAVLY